MSFDGFQGRPELTDHKLGIGCARRLAADEICLMLTSNCVFGRDLLLRNLEFERRRKIVSKARYPRAYGHQAGEVL